jgi:predicted Zn finger-like uncharacterized protein
MKFLCDRCKTRYSIADERVRGKILKIRCKNCSNVISVREGMTDAEPAPAASSSPLQDAFASVMSAEPPRRTKGETMPAPPVLEEEWYVSIDGNQSGPFSLAEAQAWVSAQKPLEELFCWCEGFDDWLPVEKVSHFRGLRAPQAPRAKTPTAARPAVKESGPMAARREPATEPSLPPVEDEPKPLFAATLAKLEAESSKVAPNPSPPKADGSRPVEKVAKPADKPTLAPLDKSDKDKSRPAEKAPSLTPLGPVSPRAPLPMPSRTSPAPLATPSTPLSRGAQAAVASAAPALPTAASALSPAALPAKAEPAALPTATPATKPFAEPVKAKAASRRPMFDTGADPVGEGEALDDSALEPDDDDDGKAKGDGTDGLDLDIGEVSRVVRLPDLMAAGAARTTGKAAAQRPVGRTSGSTAAIARGSGAAPAMAAAAGAAALGAAGPANEALPPLSEAVLADAQPQLAPSVTPRPQHGMMWMIGGAVLLVAVIAIIAVAASSGGGDAEQVSNGYHDLSGLGYSYTNPLAPNGGGTGTNDASDGSGGGSVSITGTGVVRPHPRNPGSNNTGGSQQIQPGTGRQEIGPGGEPILPLTGDDIIQVLHKNQIGYSRCYDRALKKDPMLQVEKIMVTLSVDNNGVVTDVSLNSYAQTDLGECLTAAIRRWSFRRSTDGIKTVIPLVFQQGG